MNESESTEWNIKHSRVYGNGRSYNCTNRITAIDLCNLLNGYEHEIQYNTNYEKLQQYLIALQMDISNIQADLDKIKELLK